MGHTLDCSFHGYLKDHILKKQVFTYRAQQDPNLPALSLYNNRRKIGEKKEKKMTRREAVVLS